MKDKIEKAIGVLAEKAGDQKDSNDAMRFSQAVLNLMNARVGLELNLK